MKQAPILQQSMARPSVFCKVHLDQLHSTVGTWGSPCFAHPRCEAVVFHYRLKSLLRSLRYPGLCIHTCSSICAFLVFDTIFAPVTVHFVLVVGMFSLARLSVSFSSPNPTLVPSGTSRTWIFSLLDRASLFGAPASLHGTRRICYILGPQTWTSLQIPLLVSDISPILPSPRPSVVVSLLPFIRFHVFHTLFHQSPRHISILRQSPFLCPVDLSLSH